jgi:hypothetical protein
MEACSPYRAVSGLSIVLLFVAFSPLASADENSSTRVYKGRIVRSAESVVPLQPFSVDKKATNVNVAYYAPHAVPHATRAYQDDEETGLPSHHASGPTVPGSRAALRNGVAYAPANAPERVKNAIWAVNTIRTRPYHWGGGHRSFFDSGYDCSGTVSFALHYAGVLAAPLPSSDLLRYGERGRGRWITIYSRHGHTFAMIAGLRLDTTDFRYGGDVGPRWHLDGRDTWGFEARHPVGL